MNYKDEALENKILNNYNKSLFNSDKLDSNHQRISSHNIILSKKLPMKSNIASSSIISVKPLENLIYKSIFNSLRNNTNDELLNKTDNPINKTENKENFIINKNFTLQKHISNPQKLQNIKVNKTLLINRTKTNNNIPSYILHKKINNNKNYINNNNENNINEPYRNEKEKDYYIRINTNKNKNVNNNRLNLKNNESKKKIELKKKGNIIMTKREFFKNIKDIDDLDLLNNNNNNNNNNNDIYYRNEINLTDGNLVNSNNKIKNGQYYTDIKERDHNNNKYSNKNNLKLKLNFNNNNRIYQPSLTLINNDNNNNNNNIINKSINNKFSSNSVINTQMSYSSKVMSKIKRRINSTERTNIYNITDIKNKNIKKPKFFTLSEEKRQYPNLTQCDNLKPIQMQKPKIDNIINSDNLNIGIEENIEKLKNELNKKNKIINNFTKIVSDYKGTISRLIDKNKKLGENSINLLNQIKQYQNEILLLKKENSILINNNINYNYNYNEEYIKQINDLKKELDKYKLENNHLKILIINNNINENKQKKDNSKEKIYSYRSDNILNHKKDTPKRKNIFTNKRFQEDNLK